MLRGAALCDCARLSAYSRAPKHGGKAGERAFTQEVFRCGLPLTSRISRSYSALCLRSFPALSRLPSGQAQGVAAEDRHNSPRRQSRRLPPPPAGGQHILPIWTAHTTRMDTITYGIRIQTYSHVHSSFPTWTGYAANTDRVFHPYGQESPNKYSA